MSKKDSKEKVNKKPVLWGVSAILLLISFLAVYFTMFANVNGLDWFINAKNASDQSNTSQTQMIHQTPKPTEQNIVPEVTLKPITEETAQDPITEEMTVTKTETHTDISIAITGDLLIHSNILSAGYKEDSMTYDFDNIFSKVNPLFQNADYATAFLEVPFGGKEGRNYTGFPQFNSPDELMGGITTAGIDMLLTAGTHAFDAGAGGVTRTIDTVRAKGAEVCGTGKSEADKKYIVKDIKGIKIGFLNYSAATSSKGRVILNDNILTEQQEKLINTFEYGNLASFYNKISADIQNMKNEGAEFLVLFIRWGDRYTIKPNSNQLKMAQSLCDLGIDIIVGNGTHMIQPFSVIESTDKSRTTLCMYSLGNFLSNQRKELVNYKSGHTEDGIVYKLNIRKDSKGHITCRELEYVPLWVSLGTDNGKAVYDILPKSEDTLLINGAKESYKRTEDIVDKSIKEYNNSFALDDLGD